MVKFLKKSTVNRNKLSFRSKYKLSLSNFMERRWRNLMISLATAIGFIGILISFGLGNAIVDMINEETNNGNLPAQVQISLNGKVASSTILNQTDINTITDIVGKDEIKYLESPFSTIMQKVSIDGKTLDLSTNLPSYAQIVSLYEDTSIAVSANTEDSILSGDIYSNPSEKGLTVPISFVEAFNQANQTDYTAKTIIGKELNIEIVEHRADGSFIAHVQTTIIRVTTDELEDSNSYMAPEQLEAILKDSGFTKNRPYMILELNNPDKTATITEKLKEHKKYTVLSQQEILDIIINFIRVIQGLLVVLSSQAIVVSMVMIGVIIYINIMQRSKEIGVMKAVGYLNKDVKAIFVYESMIITYSSLIISFIVALGIGTLANVIVRQQFPNITKVFALNWQSIVIMVALATVMGFVSAYFPTRKISKLDPVESLRYE
ncbi:FtsX-like permease family protein [Streptococcus minor]|uniref:FtsX-like permease family protein n=1 Tax=Streptococcus minor TaxID=229549 RepID=A0A3P1VCA6_9STRE|nr:FtsX-like permease family protein [Streptococcus minor]MDO5078156.1 FtsX-like permease family protein [Streptococcus minor]RRD31862.1 FtsX-like permease family protein [Streptococcus minor]